MPKRQEPRLSRRRFLGAVGAGAGAVALNPMGIAAAPSRSSAAHGQPSLRPERFGRIFKLRPFAEPSPAIEAALRELGRPGGLLDAADPLSAGPIQLIVDPALSANNPNNPTHTAGTTFFGQFLDHDMTFDAGSRLGPGQPVPEETNVNSGPRRSISTRSTEPGPSRSRSSTTAPTTGSSRSRAADCSKTPRGAKTVPRSWPTPATTRTS